MELGSNFEIDFTNLKYTEDNIFRYLENYHSIYMDSGRSASTILNSMLNLENGVILIPSYICGSVIEGYKEFSIVFYKINRDFSIDIQDLERKINSEVKVIYLMHYFGKLQDRECIEFLERKKREYHFIIIEDTTHSFFSRACTVGDYCICSLRKWLPIPDGGVLYSKNELDNEILNNIKKKEPSIVLEAMVLKKWYLNGQIESNNIYREIFTKAEEELDNQKEVLQISDVSRSLLECISVSEVIEKRRKNYIELNRYICKSGIESVFSTTDFVPLVYPIYVNNRDRFRSYLMENQIYCAVHWPLKETKLENNEDANKIFQNIISLPIDQRYNSIHIRYLIKTIQNYLAQVEYGTDTN